MESLKGQEYDKKEDDSYFFTIRFGADRWEYDRMDHNVTTYDSCLLKIS